MKGFFKIIIISLFFWNVSFAENYSKLKSFNDFIYGKNLLDLKCFDADGYSYIHSDRIDFNKKKVFIGSSELPFDISSTDTVINYYENVFEAYSFFSLNLNSFTLEEKYISVADSKKLNLKKKIKRKNDAFKIFDTIKPSSTRKLDCTHFWSYKIEDNKYLFFNILADMYDQGDMPTCIGEAKLNINDPLYELYKWNNCLGIKKIKDSIFIGEFLNDSLNGKGIVFTNLGHIIVGNFKENINDGPSLVYLEVDTTNRTVNDKQNRKSWIVNVEYVDGQISESIKPKFTELRRK